MPRIKKLIVEKVLTDEQIAKFLVFEHKFKQKLKKEFNSNENNGKRNKKCRF